MTLDQDLSDEELSAWIWERLIEKHGSRQAAEELLRRPVEGRALTLEEVEQRL